MKPNLTLEINTHKHIPFLDGLRGLAILLVLVYHCFLDFGPTKFGWIGVDVFFILSGFLITGILIKTKEQAGYFKNFFIRRALRIFPLYYLFLFLVFVIIPLLAPAFIGNIEYYKTHQLWFWLYAQNWLLSWQGFPENFSLHHLWSLAVEEQFYLFWPLIVYITPIKKLIYVAGGLIIVSVLFKEFGEAFGFIFPFKYVNTISRMDALILGGVIYMLFNFYPHLLKKFVVPVFLVCSTICIAFIIYKKSLFFWDLHHIYFFLDVSLACFLALLLMDYPKTKPIKNLLSKGFFKWFGKYSYGIYIFHYPLFFACSTFLLPMLNDIVSQNLIAKFFNGTICIGIACSIAYISFNFFEKPILSLKEKIA